MELVEAISATKMSTLNDAARECMNDARRVLGAALAAREQLAFAHGADRVDDAFEQSGLEDAMPEIEGVANRLLLSVADLYMAVEDAHLESRLLTEDEYQALYEVVASGPRQSFTIAGDANDALTEFIPDYFTGQFGEDDGSAVMLENVVYDLAGSLSALLHPAGLVKFKNVDNDYHQYADRVAASGT